MATGQEKEQEYVAAMLFYSNAETVSHTVDNIGNRVREEGEQGAVWENEILYSGQEKESRHASMMQTSRTKKTQAAAVLLLHRHFYPEHLSWMTRGHPRSVRERTTATLDLVLVQDQHSRTRRPERGDLCICRRANENRCARAMSE